MAVVFSLFFRNKITKPMETLLKTAIRLSENDLTSHSDIDSYSGRKDEIGRLMDGLADWQSDEELRYQHILEEMIYVSELQAKNLFLYLYAFDPEDKYAPHVYCGSYLDEGFDYHKDNVWEVDQFDIVVMNPPYQTSQEGNVKTEPLWNKFVIKTLNNIVGGGYLVAVHPDGWRSVKGKFKNIQNTLKGRQMLYLEMHNIQDGLETFGAETTYDFYCVRNVQNSGFKTKIKFMDGETRMFNISKLEFIPNGMFDTFNKVMSKNGEEKVNLLYSRSMYGTDKINMSKEQDDEFKHPCIYMTRKDGSLALWYSNTNEKHFGTPKVFWSNGRSCSVHVDKNGEYGLTQFAYAIGDDIKNLNKIKRAMETPEFLNLMFYSCGNTGHKYHQKIIATFRKDFWKEFV